MTENNHKSIPVTINSRKFDGEIARSWQADLIARNGSLLIFCGVFEREIRHDHLGVIRRGTVSYEFYWLDRYYNIFRFHEPDGSFRNFYCNINLPPVFNDRVLDYIDLDIDLLVFKDLSYKVLDEDDFKAHSEIFSYPQDLITKVRQSLEALLNLLENRSFPFDFNL